MMVSSLLKHQNLNLSLTRKLIVGIQMALDFLMIAAAFALAYLLRFDFSIPPQEIDNALWQFLLVAVVQIAALKLSGIYSFIWRYTGITEAGNFLKTAALSSLPVIALRLILPSQHSQWQVPLSIALMDSALAFGGMYVLRVIRRLIYENSEKRRHSAVFLRRSRKKVLMIGAGRSAALAAKEILSIGGSEIDLQGFIDDDPAKLGSVLQGKRVLGSTADLPRLVREMRIDHVVISISKASRQDFKRILGICESIPVKVRVVPSVYDILQGKVNVSRIRDLQIEDLLGREPVVLEQEEIERLATGKVVLVTGAGGSIGSELARQVARLRPAKLLLVERAEFALFEIDREIEKNWPHLRREPLIADINDETRMRSIFSEHRPEIVLHAAAHKHVPLMESNSVEAIKNNVLGTRLLGELSGESGVEVFVLISTDKAVRPTSVMGASKRMAELVVQDLNRAYSTNYVAVRFGNVIGSTGSVIPIFSEQIRNGGPVTVTHPQMTRYFMTIPEASQLVLQAAALGRGGEIFILDMGEPVRILDLAEEAIKMSGLKPYEDIDIVFSGIRPGEKLFEELEITEERMEKTRHPKIFIGRIAEYPSEKMSRAMTRLKGYVERGEEEQVRIFLSEFLPESRIGATDNGRATEATVPAPVAEAGRLAQAAVN